MSKIVSFKIFKGEDGYYVATAADFGIHTQGKTFEELLANIKEATEVSFDSSLDTSSPSPFPPIMMNIDFAEVAHA